MDNEDEEECVFAASELNKSVENRQNTLEMTIQELKHPYLVLFTLEQDTRALTLQDEHEEYFNKMLYGENSNDECLSLEVRVSVEQLE